MFYSGYDVTKRTHWWYERRQRKRERKVTLHCEP